jgi:hypothetical protein
MFGGSIKSILGIEGVGKKSSTSLFDTIQKYSSLYSFEPKMPW